MAIPKIKMSKGMLAYVSRERNKVEKEAPKKKECPKCHQHREFQFFGVRTHRDPKTGQPVRFSPQSYCVDCRSKKTKVERKTRVTAAKKAPPKAAVAPKETKAPKTPPKGKKKPATPKPIASALVRLDAVIRPDPAAALAHLTKAAAEAASKIEAPLPVLPENEPVVPVVASAAATMAPKAEVPAPVATALKSGKKRQFLIMDVPEKK